MSDMEVTLKLPEELVARARAVGIDVEALTPDVVTLLERQIEREERRIEQQGAFDYQEWWAQVEALQAEIRAAHGSDSHVGSLELLRELREDDE